MISGLRPSTQANFGVVQFNAILRALTEPTSGTVPALDRIHDLFVLEDYAFDYIVDFSPRFGWPGFFSIGDQTVLYPEDGGPSHLPRFTFEPPNKLMWATNGVVRQTISLAGNRNFYRRLRAQLTEGQVFLTFNSFAPGSAANALTTAIDNRLAVAEPPGVSLPLFTTQNHSAGIYVRNPDCWLHGHAGLPAISPWNSQDNNRRAGVLITPEHVLFAAHYPLNVGTTIRFVDNTNTVASRTIIDRMLHPFYVGAANNYQYDIGVARLNAALGSEFKPMKFLPSGFLSKLPSSVSGSLYRHPCVCTNQLEEALVQDWNGSGGSLIPTSDLRLPFYKNKVLFDSGNPCFLVIGDDLVLLFALTFGGPGGGTFVTNEISAINSMISALGSITPGLEVEIMDLSGFPSY